MPRETPTDYYRLSLDDIVRKPNKLYVIAAEGDRTEFKYFEAVRDQYGAEFTKQNWHLEILFDEYLQNKGEILHQKM